MEKIINLWEIKKIRMGVKVFIVVLILIIGVLWFRNFAKNYKPRGLVGYKCDTYGACKEITQQEMEKQKQEMEKMLQENVVNE